MNNRFYFHILALCFAFFIPIAHAKDIYCDGSVINLNAIIETEVYEKGNDNDPQQDIKIFFNIHGTCLIDSPIKLDITGFIKKNNVVIQGEGAEESIIRVIPDKNGIYPAAFDIEGATGITIKKLSIENGNPGLLIKPAVIDDNIIKPQVAAINLSVINSQGTGLQAIGPGVDALSGEIITFQSQLQSSAAICADLPNICPKNESGTKVCSTSPVNICDTDFIGSNGAGLHAQGVLIFSCNVNDDNPCKSVVNDNDQGGFIIDSTSNFIVNNSNIEFTLNDAHGISIDTSDVSLSNHTVLASANNGRQGDFLADSAPILCDETSQIISASGIQGTTELVVNCAEKPPVDVEQIPLPHYVFLFLFSTINLIFFAYRLPLKARSIE